MKIKTNSLEPGEPKNTEDSALFTIYQAFATEEETAKMAEDFAAGIGWGDAKQVLFEKINAHLAEPREKYQELMAKPEEIYQILDAGASKARVKSKELMEKLRAATGISL